MQPIKLPNRQDTKLRYDTYRSISESTKNINAYIEQFDKSDKYVFTYAYVLAKNNTDGIFSYEAYECYWDEDVSNWISISGGKTWNTTADYGYDDLITLNNEDFTIGTVVLAVAYPGDLSKWFAIATSQVDQNRSIPAQITSKNGDVYNVNLYANGIDQSSTGTGIVQIMQVCFMDTIPNGTLLMVSPIYMTVYDSDESSSSESSED